MASEPPSPSGSWASLGKQLRAATLSVLVLTAVAGALFPLVVVLLARAVFPRQAAGSLLVRSGRVMGSELIGQDFRGLGYFHPRPSAAGAGYDGLSSGGSNLGPLNPKLTLGAPADSSNQAYDGVAELAAAFRRENGLSSGSILPADAVTRSGSGLDPHISPANAALQTARVARARHLLPREVSRLVAAHTEPRQWFFLGEPRVNVLALNIALDRMGAAKPGERP